jgi:CRISPR system Cascade subunit CasE
MSELQLVRWVLDRRALARVAAKQHLPSWVDDGYLLHAGLSQLFATSRERAEVPLECFAVDDVYAEAVQKPELLFVLAYAKESASALEAKMGPAREAILRGFDSKPAPSLDRGTRATFRTRVCPVVRTKQPGEGEREVAKDSKGRSKSREVDAFVHRVMGVERDKAVSREAVYGQWLKGQLEANGACAMESATLVEFRRENMRRRGREHGGRIERPNAVLEGTLTVGDPTAFAALLARGVGRHRAFGFGMLLLRPVR